MKIGILGAGFVGQSFAKAVMAPGHEVMFSSRDPQSEKMQKVIAEIGGQAGTVEETVAFGEMLALALRWTAVPDVVHQGDWSGKTVIDMTNRFSSDDDAHSAARELAAMIPGAHVVKTLNIIGAEHYTQPDFNGQKATMFVAGDDASARASVMQIVAKMGFDAVDAGKLSAADHLESLAAFWVHLAMTVGHGRDIGFKLLKR